MFRFLLMVGLLFFAAGAGYYLGLPDDSETTSLRYQLEQISQKNAELTERNVRLEGTLDLVKRQIQTDRIAYQSMRDDLDNAELQREQVLSKLKAQRTLLDQLKKKIAQ